MTLPHLLTTREVMDILRVSRSTVKRMRDQGELAYFVRGEGTGKRCRFFAQDVHRYMEEHRRA